MPRCRLPPPKLLPIAILAMLPVLSAYAAPQSAPPHVQHDNRAGHGQSVRNSLSDAVRRIERDTRGEVLSAERVQFDGRDMHRVKVVDDEGRVRVFMQDPNRRYDNPAGSDRMDSRRDNGNERDGNGGSSQRRLRPTRGNDD